MGKSGFRARNFPRFYQDVIERGYLQSEIVRPLAAPPGIVAPTRSTSCSFIGITLRWNAAAVPMSASIFAIDLFFGALFRRSGNLWIVAVIHGIGNAYIVASLAAAR